MTLPNSAWPFGGEVKSQEVFTPTRMNKEGVEKCDHSCIIYYQTCIDLVTLLLPCSKCWMSVQAHQGRSGNINFLLKITKSGHA